MPWGRIEGIYPSSSVGEVGYSRLDLATSCWKQHGGSLKIYNELREKTAQQAELQKEYAGHACGYRCGGAHPISLVVRACSGIYRSPSTADRGGARHAPKSRPLPQDKRDA
ncbi:hypothetical protein NE237_000324 [Protea cynaroides]|uniref:Uncharacterized protein n=1 Tax=Protea cynaroides TaxID=273540 RepID=A0A9Q0KR11_9MAGN|nr:hypothetical protein NE237_000324 [Protea cynaroides]